jgi:hypothetical protein
MISNNPEELVHQSAQVLARFWFHLARSMNWRRKKWDDIWLTDSGSHGRIINNATMIRSIDPSKSADIARKLRDFYHNSQGGGYSIWDPWQCLDLAKYGYSSHELPLMIRPTGGEIPPPPEGLKIIEVEDAETLKSVEITLIEGWPVPTLNPSVPGTIWDKRILGDEAFRIWLGVFEERPVSCSHAFIDRDFILVGPIATVPEMRQRGFGKALTWQATMAMPSLPAMLHASELGKPVYERIGYYSVAGLTLWSKDDRS